MTRQSLDKFDSILQEQDYVIHLERGIIQFHKNQFQQAIKCFDEACYRLNYFFQRTQFTIQEYRLSLYYSSALSKLAMMNYPLGQWEEYYEEAISYFTLSITILEYTESQFINLEQRVQYKKMFSKTLLERARLNQKLEEYDEIMEDIVEAIDILKGINTPTIELMSAYLQLGSYYQLVLDEDNYQQAKDCYKKVEEIYNILEQAPQVEILKHLKQQAEKLEKHYLELQGGCIIDNPQYESQFAQPKLNNQLQNLGVKRQGKMLE